MCLLMSEINILMRQHVFDTNRRLLNGDAWD